MKKGLSKFFKIFNICLTVFFCSVIVFLLVLRFNYAGFYIDGDSMLPTIVGAHDVSGVPQKGGDYIYVNKSKKPQRGDIVVCDAPYRNDSSITRVIIKRVIALEGDCVKIIDGRVFIRYAGTEEYEELEEDYVSVFNNLRRENYYHDQPIAEGYIFVLGDNRDVSNDSRGSFGDIPADCVIGTMDGLSYSFRPAFTWWYTLWHYDVPNIFH